MKTSLHIILVVSLFFLIHSCQFIGPSVQGDGQVTTENRAVSGFEKVKASRGIEVYLIPDSTEYVVVEADQNLHEYIRTELKHETLEVYVERRMRSENSRKVLVHFVRLDDVESSAGAIVRANEVLNLRAVELSASSGSQQYLALEVDSIDTGCSSGAQLHLSGQCRKVGLQASSGALLRAAELSVEHCDADVSSGAQIEISVQSGLKAEASSGGQIRYSGNPAQTEIHKSSGGLISAVN